MGHILIFERIFGRPAMDALYLQGRVTVMREAHPSPLHQNSAA